MSRIRKILGSINIEGTKHAIGKLENGKFAVGKLYVTQVIDETQYFACINTAFDHWYAGLNDGEIFSNGIKD